MFAKRASWGFADRASHWEYPLSCHPMGGGQWSFREHQHDLQTMLMTYPKPMVSPRVDSDPTDVVFDFLVGLHCLRHRYTHIKLARDSESSSHASQRQEQGTMRRRKITPTAGASPRPQDGRCDIVAIDGLAIGADPCIGTVYAGRYLQQWGLGSECGKRPLRRVSYAMSQMLCAVHCWVR